MDSLEKQPNATRSPHANISHGYRPLRLLRTAIIAVLLFVALHVYYLQHVSGHRPSQTSNKLGDILWEECPPGSLPNVDCGSVIVPKDYFNVETGGTASIAFATYRAKKTPSKGSVFLNPGMGLAAVAGPQYAALIGDDWDLVGFDPRGIGQSKPAVQCFPDFITHQLYISNTVVEGGITTPPMANFSSPLFRENVVEQFRQLLVIKQSQAERCGEVMGDELKFMGTATVARDLEFMTRVFDGEDAKVNFHGASYGAIIGVWLVNMFPERVGYIVIDGIVDPVSWANEPTHEWAHNWLSSAEAAYEYFLKDCAQAGPSLCPLAKEKSEPWENIEARLEDFFDSLVHHPLPVPDGRRPGFLTSGAVRGMMLLYLMRPTGWAASAAALHAAMQGNGTAIFNALIADYDKQIPGPIPLYDLTRQAVACLDAPPPEGPEDMPTPELLADQGILNLKEVSRHFGLSIGVVERDGGCEYWPARGPERFNGPWNASLDRPMLIVSNTADPITPIASGSHVNALMPAHSSSLIIQEGPGHSSLLNPSLCIAKLKHAYFEGNTPVNGSFCKNELQTFPELGATSEATQLILDGDLRLRKAINQLAIYHSGGEIVI
ncbi:hypothetical protein BDZ97DRAFT_1667553 [Flammula alnicola]|nr:hypothetical protein BDZ97DRAFT_1667553 [Flammula alnicola]